MCRIGCGGVPMRVYSRAMGAGSWNMLEYYLYTKDMTFYTNSHGHFVHFTVFPSVHILDNIIDNEPFIIYTDAFGRVVSSREISRPYPDYWAIDDYSYLILAVPAWIVPAFIIVGVLAVLAVCALHAMQRATQLEQAIEPGNDKFKHCVAGCLLSLCSPIPPGTPFEIFQGLTSGFDPDWPIDAGATDIGFLIGKGCLGIGIANPGIGLLVGGYEGCCVTGCRVSFGGYYQGGGLFGWWH